MSRRIESVVVCHSVLRPVCCCCCCAASFFLFFFFDILNSTHARTHSPVLFLRLVDLWFGFHRFLPPILSEDFEENERLLEDVYATQRTYVDDTNYAEVFYEELLSPTEWVRLRTAFEKGFEWDSDSRLFTLDDMYAVEKAAEEQLLAEEAAAAEAEAAGLGGGGGLDGMDSFDDIDGLASMDLGLDLGMDLGLDDESWGALGLDAPAADANGANGAESGGSGGGGGGGEVVPDVLAKQLDDFDVGAQDLEMGMEV